MYPGKQLRRPSFFSFQSEIEKIVSKVGGGFAIKFPPTSTLNCLGVSECIVGVCRNTRDCVVSEDRKTREMASMSSNQLNILSTIEGTSDKINAVSAIAGDDSVISASDDRSADCMNVHVVHSSLCALLYNILGEFINVCS